MVVTRLKCETLKADGSKTQPMPGPISYYGRNTRAKQRRQETRGTHSDTEPRAIPQKWRRSALEKRPIPSAMLAEGDGAFGHRHPSQASRLAAALGQGESVLRFRIMLVP